VSTVLSGALALFATMILYLGVLRIFPAHRARDMILAAQVGMTILIFGSMQLAPRLVGRDALIGLLESNTTLHYAIPPLYYGELFKTWSSTLGIRPGC